MSDTPGSQGPMTDGPGDPPPSSPDTDAPRPERVDQTPPAVGPGAPEDQTEVQPVAVPGEQIEWQPVSTGDAITWQPVVASGDGGSGPDWEDPAVDEPAGDPSPWAAAGATVGSAAANGAAGAGYDPDTPPPSRPAGSRSVAARRRAAQAAAPRPPAGGDPAPDKTRRQVILLSVATLAVVAVAVVAFILSRGALDEGEQGEGGTTATTSRTAPTLADTEFQGYRDEATGFSLRYPKTWIKYVPPASDYRLAVAIQPPDTDGFWVRVYPIQTEATEENIGNFKAVTDAIAFGDGSAKLIQEQLVRVNGRLAYYYLYTFEDEFTRNQGIHAQYFIFEGLRMFSLVFQSIPADDFPRQAGIFDQIAESFLAEPPRPGATTTTPPTTTG